ncbi:hypothetical protein T11_13011 [Trichinella zimbabwensis]|uniref:Uncharacterized protein n=1 Tax=Trichinella zimbabwensis TaxID=268475 RepID=A0A0V1HHC0_9BILA|nr:hypothetical protein T11_13011 [Trichinella zimbabwensis]
MKELKLNSSSKIMHMEMDKEVSYCIHKASLKWTTLPCRRCHHISNKELPRGQYTLRETCCVKIVTNAIKYHRCYSGTELQKALYTNHAYN